MTLIRTILGISVVGLAMMTAVALALELYWGHTRPSIYAVDGELGWRLKANVKHSFAQRRKDGTRYEAQFSTNDLALRESGSGTIRVLILGDSSTADPFAGDGEMWYAVGRTYLEKAVGLKPNSLAVLAGGGGGYGTLQNLLLLRRLKKHVSPDIFVLQFCSNDFSNNHMLADSGGIVRSQYMRRPYYQLDGTVVFVEHPLVS